MSILDILYFKDTGIFYLENCIPPAVLQKRRLVKEAIKFIVFPSGKEKSV
jgi:hypothetical protein